MRQTARRSVVQTCVALAAGAVGLAGTAPGEAVVFARHLSLSPDGRELAFSWAGDIWSVSSEGGTAARLTVNAARDAFPVWSRDGRRIAFASDRHGEYNVFVMQRDGTGVARLTFSDRDEIPSGWSADDADIYFFARREGRLEWDPHSYRVPAAGGQSWRLFDGLGGYATASADGGQFAFVRGGAEWWRRRYRGSASFDVWLWTPATNAYRALTTHAGNDRLPQWDARGAGVFYLSDRGAGAADALGPANVWYQPLAGNARPITSMQSDDVRDFAVSADGRTLAFTHWDKLYVQSLPDGSPRAIEVRAGDDSPQRDIELRTYARDASETEASPDGKELAIVVRGEIFVTRSEPDKPTRRVTNSAARDRDVVWSPDGKALFFVSDAEGQEDVHRATSAETPPRPLADSLRFRIERVTDNAAAEVAPAISPDGKKLAFVRGRGDLVVRDLKSGTESTLVQSWNPPSYRWSPDSKRIAYEVEDDEYNPDVWIAPADGSSPAVNISRHPDYDGNPQWSADGQVLAFASRRDGFDNDLYLVFLSPALDEKSDVALNEYFEKAAESVKKRKPLKRAIASGKIALGAAAPHSQPSTGPTSEPTSQPASQPAHSLRAFLRSWLKGVLEEDKSDDKNADEEKKEGDAEKKAAPAEKFEPELETAWRRVRRVTRLAADQASFALAPDGALLAFSSSHEGSPALFQVKWNGEEVKKIVTAGVGALHWQLDGSRLFYLKTGVPGSCKAGGADAKSHEFAAKMAISRRAEAAQKFDDAARYLRLRFYESTMKGLDWAALAAKYRPLALAVPTSDEFNEVFNMLQGELNASHMGISGPGGSAVDRVGYLGCTFEREFAGPGLRVASVLKNSPADRAESRLYAGDVILRLNGAAVGPQSAVEAALIDTVGDEVIVEYLPSPTRPESQPASAPATAPATQPEAPATQAAPRELVIRPIAYNALGALAYEAWVEGNRRFVEEKSAGRLGYLHIRGMGEGEFYRFERDLYAAAHGKEGLLIDVRNNGGGWTADWVLAVLSVQPHAYTVSPGGGPGYPQDRRVFYSWTRPTAMLCNQYSFSNAEIVSHAFKTLRRGPLVGMTTYGGVISTGSYGLIDGSRIRSPGRGWFVQGTDEDMELHGAVPDVLVPVTPADEAAERRPQLEAAVEALIRTIGAAAKP